MHQETLLGFDGSMGKVRLTKGHSPMRVAYFNANLRPGQDGVTRVLSRVFQAAVERGVEAIAFASDIPDRDHRAFPMYKVPSVVLPFHKAYRVALPGHHGFARQLRAFRPDIIHINSPCTLGFAAAKYARDVGIPAIATYHTHFPSYTRYYKVGVLEGLAWRLVRQFYNNLDRTLVPTRAILNELDEHGVHRLFYLPNGVETASFSPTHRSHEWRRRVGAENKIVILFVSRLVWEKDLRILAEVFTILTSRRDDFVFVVVGDGHARSDLEAMMPQARFLGFQSGKVLQESYASADIFLFPSTTETFGLVTIEAMASGLVPVAARTGGAVDIIEDGISGLLAQPLGAADMARCTEQLMDNPGRRQNMSQRAISRAQEFGWEVIMEDLFRTYEEVIREALRTRHARTA